MTWRRPGAWLVAPPLLLVAVGFALPVAGILAEAADPAAWEYAMSPFVRHVLEVSLRQAALSTALAMAVAVPLAWLHHAARPAAPRLQLALHAAPFVMPVFVIVYGLQETLGSRGWLAGATGIDALGALGPLGAVVLAHAYYNYGFAARLLESGLRRRPRALEEAARTLGASPRAAFARATLPILLPQALAVALLVFLFTFGSFGVVLLLGAGQVQTLETVMYGKVTGLFGEMPHAAALGVLELGLNVLLLLGYLALRRRFARVPAEPEAARRRAGPALSALSWLLTVLALLPLAAVLVQGFRVQGAWSLEPWRHLLQDSPLGFDLGRALGLSLFYAVGSTMASLALAASLAYGSRHLGALRRPLEAVASVPVAGSGILLGVAFLSTFGAGGLLAQFGASPFDGTVGIVLLAHTVLAFPFVVRLLLPAFEARDQALGETARLLGAPPHAVLARVDWPLLRPAALAAAGISMALSLGDFGASSLLMEEGSRGLSVWVAHLDGPFDPFLHTRAVALAGLLCALTLGAYLLVERLGLPRERRSPLGGIAP